MELRRVYPKRVGITTLTDSAVLQFTADRRYSIERWMVSNISNTDVTVSIYIVPSGSSVSDSNAMVKLLNIVSYDNTVIAAPVVLEVGEKVYALASSVSSINLWFHVNEVEMSIQ